jgi:hypothetical protein
MKMLGAVLLLIVVVGGFGFFRGWFSVSSEPAGPTTRNVDVNLSVDRDKIDADADAVKEKVEELTGEAKD